MCPGTLLQVEMEPKATDTPFTSYHSLRARNPPFVYRATWKNTLLPLIHTALSLLRFFPFTATKMSLIGLLFG